MIKIRKYIKIFNLYIEFKKITSIYYSFLQKGNFVISTESKKIIYLLGDVSTAEFVKKEFENKKDNKGDSLSKKVKNLIKKTIFNCLKIKNKSKENPTAESSIVMISWDNDLKFFDIINEKVITVFKNTKKLNRYVIDMDYFKMYFNLPFLYKEGNIVYEKLINNTIEMSECNKEKYYLNMVRHYTNYFKKIKSENFERSSYVINTVNNDWKNIFNEFLLSEKQFKNIEFPIYYMHSDLHFDNVLISNNKIYYIDWEHSSFKPFFYDVFNVLFIEIMNHNDLNLTSKYLNGKFDEMFIDLFNSVNLEFESDLREAYFIYFIFYRFIYFDLVNNEVEGVLKRYKKLIDRFKKLMYD